MPVTIVEPSHVPSLEHDVDSKPMHEVDATSVASSEEDDMLIVEQELEGHEWLGGEAILLSINDEKRGVRDILAALSKEEREEMKDLSMPIRHFRAEKGNTNKAIQKLRATLKWRKEYQVDKIVSCMEQQTSDNEGMRKELIEQHNTGFLYVRGYDEDGRAIIHGDATAMKLGSERSQMQAFIYLLEKAAACTARKSVELKSGQNGAALEKFVVVVDYSNFTSKDRSPIRSIKTFIQALQNHYPERLSVMYLRNPPVALRVVYAIVRPFLDPVTRKKLMFCNEKKDFEQFTSTAMDLKKIEPRFGGSAEKEFDATEYLHLPQDMTFDE